MTLCFYGYLFVATLVFTLLLVHVHDNVLDETSRWYDPIWLGACAVLIAALWPILAVAVLLLR